MNIINYRKSLTVTATVLFGLALVINFADYFTLAQPERNLPIFLLKTGCWIAAPVCLIVSMKQSEKNRYRDIYFAGGCFWGTEKYFKLIKGVVETEKYTALPLGFL